MSQKRGTMNGMAARLEPGDAVVKVPNKLGQLTDTPSPGVLVFELEGRTFRLTPTGNAGEELSIIFGDATNAHLTYGGGRFLDTEAPVADGTVILDFNKAYNPPCVFTPYATCPLPGARNTLDLPVFQHALAWLEQNEGTADAKTAYRADAKTAYRPQIVVQLRPTSPFRRVAHVQQAILNLSEHPEADSIRTVCVPFQNPFKMWRIEPDGFMAPLMQAVLFTAGEHAEPYNMPRQLLPDVYWQTGYVDAAWRRTIVEQNSMTGRRILPLVIDPSEWIDIDSPDDWQRAERLLASGDTTLQELGL
ncbi:MAG: DUF1684 domain-containing protein [Anaerolineales bacterium]|nr:DUF1684 domain-containing protein [Anaerolineales bacterium]